MLVLHEEINKEVNDLNSKQMVQTVCHEWKPKSNNAHKKKIRDTSKAAGLGFPYNGRWF